MARPGNRARARFPLGMKIELRRRGERASRYERRVVERSADDCGTAPAARKRHLRAKTAFRAHFLRVTGRAFLRSVTTMPTPSGDDGVVGDHDAARHVVVRLDAHAIGVIVHEDVGVERDVALALEQRLVAILVEEVAVDRVVVFGAAPFARKVADERRWARGLSGEPAFGLAKTLWRMIGDARARRHARQVGPRELVLDLQVVPDRVDDDVALDQPRDERRAAVGIAEVHTRAGADDRDASDHPVPGRALGRDADDLLVVAVTADDEVLERDVVRRAWHVPSAFTASTGTLLPSSTRLRISRWLRIGRC